MDADSYVLRIQRGDFVGGEIRYSRLVLRYKLEVCGYPS